MAKLKNVVADQLILLARDGSMDVGQRARHLISVLGIE